MDWVILLTGRPGCGKTTVIQRVLDEFYGDVGGFYTQEIRAEGRRKGFEIITLDGNSGILSHVDIRGAPRIGKYGVNLQGLKDLAAPSILDAIERGSLVVIDEIGPMEILSPYFCEAVIQALSSGVKVLGTIVQRSTPFSDKVKSMPNVRLVEVNPGNRQELPGKILAWLSEHP
jgi:nucleoside-triphosphatase